MRVGVEIRPALAGLPFDSRSGHPEPVEGLKPRDSFRHVVVTLTSRNIPHNGRRPWQVKLHIIDYMNPLLVELDDEVAAKLEQVAPGRARRRSDFIRMAVRRALWDLEEQATAEAYQRVPDSTAEASVDPAVWEPRPKRRRVRR